MTEPLSDLVVLEVSGDIATRYCGKLFAAHGARVVQTYTPDDRAIGYGGAATAAYAAWLDAGKHQGRPLPPTSSSPARRRPTSPQPRRWSAV